MLKIQETDSAEKLRAHVKLTSNEDCNTFSATMKKEEKETINAGKQFSFPNSKPSPQELLMSPRSTHPNLFRILDTSYVWNTTRTRNYLLCNRVRVYTEFPDFTFPKGITVLPIAEDKWVAISLEFPNEESNWSSPILYFLTFKKKLQELLYICIFMCVCVCLISVLICSN